MTDTKWAEQLLDRFALPLVHGAAVVVGAPLARRGARRLLSAIAGGLDGTPVAEALAEARQRRLLELLPAAPVPRLADDRSAALLLIALHDLLFLHHPAASRLSERQAELLRSFTLQLCERAGSHLPTAAIMLPDALDAAPSPTESGDALRFAQAEQKHPGRPSQLGGLSPMGSGDALRFAQAEQRLLGRHSLLSGLFHLWRADTRARTLGREREYRGVVPPPPRLRLLFGRVPLALPERRQVQVLPELVAQPESAAVLRALLAASPLTALLPPAGSVLRPALAEQARWLRIPAVARLVVARYLALGAEPALAEVGGAVSARLRQREHPLPSGDLMTLLCLVGHLHVCVALSGAPPPPGELLGSSRDSHALYAAVAKRWPQLAAPPDVLADSRLSARLTGYVKACCTAVGPALVREFDELCQGALAALDEEPDVAIHSGL